MSGSWSGRDPALRRLRFLAAGVILLLLAWTTVTGQDNVGTVGTLVGALLILLGFEAGLRWPPGGGKDED